jgi:alpha/beta superfamily hydrolase
MEHQITIRSDGIDLAATLHYPSTTSDKNPIIIIAHGFIGNRIGINRLFIKAARELSREGFMVLRFDYAGCGESSGIYGSSSVDAMIDQTRCVVDYALQIGCVDPTRVILLGHSLGGAIALLTAARDKRVKSLVLWSAVAYPFSDILKITGKKLYEDAVQLGIADYLGYAFEPQFFDSLTKHQPLEQTRKFGGDVLLVQGTDDELIPVDYCFLYQKLFWMRSQGQCDKEVIFQADHTFSSSQSFSQLMSATNNWLNSIEKQKSEWHGWTI